MIIPEYINNSVIKFDIILIFLYFKYKMMYNNYNGKTFLYKSALPLIYLR